MLPDPASAEDDEPEDTDAMFETIPPEGAPLPGGRYVLRRLLGRGGQGDAFLADDVALTRSVVIKLLMNVTDPSMRDRFSSEARILANIHHPAVVLVFDIGALPDGRPYYVMECVNGVTLTEFVRQAAGMLPETLALTLIAEAAEGLAAAHRSDVIHRDIKPDNILVTKDRHAKLIDFGIAKKIMLESAGSQHTRAGSVLGTPRFMSPEQAKGMHLTGASDLYSLGCVLYFLLTGRPPFEGDPMQAMMHHVGTPAPTLAASGCGRAFDGELEGVVARLLTKDPARRWQNGDELAAALRMNSRRAQLYEMASEPTTDVNAVPEALRGLSSMQPQSPSIAPSHSAPAVTGSTKELEPSLAIRGPSTAARSSTTSGHEATEALPPLAAMGPSGDHILTRDPTAAVRIGSGSKKRLAFVAVALALGIGGATAGVLLMRSRDRAVDKPSAPVLSNASTSDERSTERTGAVDSTTTKPEATVVPMNTKPAPPVVSPTAETSTPKTLPDPTPKTPISKPAATQTTNKPPVATAQKPVAKPVNPPTAPTSSTGAIDDSH